MKNCLILMKFGAQKQIPIKMAVMDLTKIQNFPNSRWWLSAVFKIAFWPMAILSTELSYFGQILCKDEKHILISNFRKMKMADGRHFEKCCITVSQVMPSYDKAKINE